MAISQDLTMEEETSKMIDQEEELVGAEKSATIVVKSDSVKVKPVKKHQTSYFETLVHLFKAGVGSGCFTLGEAFGNIGILLGFCIIIFLSIVCLYEQHVLINCANDVRNHFSLEQNPDYAMTFELSLRANKKWERHSLLMRRVVNTCLILTQLGFCSASFLFIGNNMRNVLIFFGWELNLRVVIILALVPIILPSLITNLKFLAPFSAIASVCVLTGIGITLYYILEDLPDIRERDMALLSWTKLPLFFGTSIYLFENIGLVLPLMNAMKTPSNFSRPLGVLNVGVAMQTLLFITLGVFGYWKYGPDVKGSLTLNLPEDDWLARSVLLILCSGTILGYAIQLYTPMQIMFPTVQKLIKPAARHPVTGEVCFRAVIVLITLGIALVVPNLGLLISLVGAVCGNSLALLFPVLIEYLVVTRDEKPVTSVFIAKNGFVLLLAVVGFVSGGYESFREIVALY